MDSIEDGRSSSKRGQTRLIREHPFVAAIFGLLHAMTHGNEIPVTMGCALSVLEDLQLFSFALRPNMGYGKMPSWFPLIFNPMSAKPDDDIRFAALFYIAFVVTIFTAGLTLVVGFSMKGSQIRVVWPLQILRIMTTLLATVLFIPLLEIFLHGLACMDTSNHTVLLVSSPSSCFTSKYLPEFILSIISLLYLSVQGVVISLIFFRIDPMGKDPHAKTTGRIDALYSCLRMLLSVCATIAADDPAAVLTAIIISSTIMLYLTCRYQPYFKGVINDARAGMCFGSLICGITSAIVHNHPEWTDSAAPFGFVCSLVLPGIAIGFALSRKSRERTAARVYAQLKAAMKSEGPRGRDGTLSRKTNLKRKGSLLQTNTVVGSNDVDLESSQMEPIDNIVKKHEPKAIKLFASSYDVELSLRFLQHNADTSAKKLATILLRRGAEQFPGSPNVHLMQAHYISYFELGPSSEIWDCLVAAKAAKPHVDTRFCIFMEEMSLEQERRKEDLVASSMGVARYAEVNALEEEAERYHVETLIAIKKLWQFLRNEKDKFACLPYLLEHMQEKRLKALSRYENLVAKFPNSKKILQSYASFLLRATDDPEKCKKLLAQLQELEKEEARSAAAAAANAGLARNTPTKTYSSMPSMPTVPSMVMESNSAVQFNIANDDDEIQVGEDAAGASRRFKFSEPSRDSTKSRPGGKSVTTMPHPEVSLGESSKKAPPAPRSVTGLSSGGSQRERNQRYLKDAIAKGLKNPIDTFNITASALICLIFILIVGGFGFCLSVYSQILSALPLAYDRARPRIFSSRFTMYARQIRNLGRGVAPVGNPATEFNTTMNLITSMLGRTWEPVCMALLEAERLGDPLDIVIRDRNAGGDHMEAYSTFTLGRSITNHVNDITALDITNSQYSLAPLWFIDNMNTMATAYTQVASDATATFMTSITGSINGMSK
ncbi:uncharacterized protein EV422DRAFT_265038 [Fimicolochytrium jonesii]|uniref:uncharacterized protein n=1 Tax=Fimicolochytrium jonesii TaxID=1396493 RepID=UPI0022FF0BE8|nr:uncharacterized protein EV422DRAFT_265038 [Fimicolochytrium jonesii]KAI8816899.1 hypothetical protein EV422DRAFT_265038 [Fimicolochytrium jonesii]